MRESAEEGRELQSQDTEAREYAERQALREKKFEGHMVNARRHIEAARYWDAIARSRGE